MKEIQINTQEICEKLESQDRCDRQSALRSLKNLFEDQETKSDQLILVYEDCYLHILKCYADKYESCRESACNLITEAIARLPRNDYYLQYIIGTLAGRIGKKEIIETSEEMRLILIQQLNFLIERFKSPLDCEKLQDKLLKSYNEIIDIILKTLTDDYPAIQKEACFSIKLLASSTPSFHYRCEILAKPLRPLLVHKHCQNRMAAIECLGIICLNITSNGQLIRELIQDISPSLMDIMPLVRLECGKVGILFLMELRDRYSFFENIIPLVLCCLKDESLEVRDYIKPLWLKCGKLFYDENETELSKIEVADEIPSNYPKDVERPSLGCRGLVQRALRTVNLIMRESSDWKEEVRLHSLKLLYQFILHTEDTLTAKFFEIYRDLSRACADPENQVTKEALKCCDLLGRLLKYESWIQTGIEGLEKHHNLGFLKCFYTMYGSSLGQDTNDILSISKLLSKSDFCHNMKPEFQEYVLKLTEKALEKYETSQEKQNEYEASSTKTLEKTMENLKICSGNEKYFYHVIIKVMSLSFEDNENMNYEFGKKVLLKLAQYDEAQLDYLHKKYLISVLETLDTLDADNDGNSEPILLLHGIIRICCFRIEYLPKLKDCIKIVWEHALPDGKIKIISGISIAMLKWNDTMKIDSSESINILRDFIEEIIKPHLIWKAGASAESMRSLAVATLCSMAQGAKEEAPQILPQYSSLFPSLLDDRKVTTRCYALKCFTNFGEIQQEQLKPVGYAILNRLDDPCSEIREWAARTFPLIKPEYMDEENKINIDDLIKYGLNLLFLHFDGPELKLKAIIKNSLITLGKNYPNIFHQKYQEFLQNCTNKDELIEVQMCVVKD